MCSVASKNSSTTSTFLLINARYWIYTRRIHVKLQFYICLLVLPYIFHPIFTRNIRSISAERSSYTCSKNIRRSFFSYCTSTHLAANACVSQIRTECIYMFMNLCELKFVPKLIHLVIYAAQIGILRPFAWAHCLLIHSSLLLLYVIRFVYNFWNIKFFIWKKKCIASVRSGSLE